MMIKSILQNTSKIEWEMAKQPQFNKCYEHISTEQLKKLQSTLLSILIDFNSFSEENNIEYAIVAGTLIGAVRHKGFIPWDDDIDIILPREDYEKLRIIFSNSSLSSKYQLIFPDIDNDISLCAKLAIKNASLNSILGNEYSDEDLIYIDLLPVDRIPSNFMARQLIGRCVNILSTFYSSLRCWERYTPHLHEFAKRNPILKWNLVIRKVLSLPALLLGRKLTLNIIHFLLKIGKSSDATVGLGVKKYFGEIIKYDDFFPSKKINFSSIDVNAPRNTSIYLENRYGDYMRIPQQSEQQERLVRLKRNWRIYIND